MWDGASANGSDAFRFDGGTTREDLLLELQLLAAQLTDPGYRPGGVATGAARNSSSFTRVSNTRPTVRSSWRSPTFSRTAIPASACRRQEVMVARNLDEVKAWLTPQLAHGPLEVALVGDLDIEASIAAAAKTIGALPTASRNPRSQELKKVKFFRAPVFQNPTHRLRDPESMGPYLLARRGRSRRPPQSPAPTWSRNLERPPQNKSARGNRRQL